MKVIKESKRFPVNERIIREKIEQSMKNGRGVYNFLLSVVKTRIRDRNYAEDAASIALWKVWGNAEVYKYPIDRRIPLEKDRRFRNWSRKIAINETINAFRNRIRPQKREFLETEVNYNGNFLEIVGTSEESDPFIRVAYTESDEILKRRLLNAVPLLPETHRRCIELFYFGKKEYSDIADILQIPMGSVKSRLHYAKNRLREILKTSFLTE